MKTAAVVAALLVAALGGCGYDEVRRDNAEMELDVGSALDSAGVSDASVDCGRPEPQRFRCFAYVILRGEDVAAWTEYAVRGGPDDGWDATRRGGSDRFLPRLSQE